MRIKKKELEIKLAKLKTVSDPKIKLEQYTTPSGIVAEILLWANNFNDVFDRSICDLGCGSGRFAIGAALIGAKDVVGVDIDPKSIKIAKENAKKMNVDITWVNSSISDIDLKFDTVFQNPPFGTRIKHHDRIFLEKAINIGKVIYSIHKSSNKVREFINRYVEDLDCKVTNTISVDFNISPTYEFHKKHDYNVKIDVYRIIRGD